MAKGYILCVDDELTVLETLSEQLRERFGKTHEIEIAGSAEEALSLIEEIRSTNCIVEMVISDQVMPGMKGDKFLEEVHSKIPDAIKIMLTGQAGVDAAANAINKGGLSRFVEKPWDIEILSSEIKSLLIKFKENLENQHLVENLNRRIKELEESANLNPSN